MPGTRSTYHASNKVPVSGPSIWGVGVSCGRGETMEGVGRAGWGEEEALGPVTAEVFEDVKLLGGLDTFGDDGQAEGVGELDDRGSDRLFSFIAFKFVDEGPVDLHKVERELAEGRERRVARAEVIDADLDARVSQRP